MQNGVSNNIRYILFFASAYRHQTTTKQSPLLCRRESHTDNSQKPCFISCRLLPQYDEHYHTIGGSGNASAKNTSKKSRIIVLNYAACHVLGDVIFRRVFL